MKSGHVFRKDLSQWLTPRHVIREVHEWAQAFFPYTGALLDPATGDGRLLDFDYPRTRVGMDLDLSITKMANPAPWDHLYPEEDFLTSPRFGERQFGVAIMNPPYEQGKDLEFVVKAMCLSDRVVAILRASFLHNKGTQERVLNAEGWRLRGVLALGRVRFEGLAGSNGPRHDFIAIDLIRGAEGKATWERAK